MGPARSRQEPSIRATVARDGSQKLGGSSLTIGTRVTAPAASRVRVTASGKVTIRGSKKAILLTRTTRVIAAGRSASLKLGLPGAKGAARAAFARISAAVQGNKHVTATLAIVIIDAAGTRREVRRTVTLV